ncbi:hypothetical protein [Encephalitozoon cuniculi GB-M1]|uniref:Uncharacterized protein n=1 Tax=Encephalitozoon cuniculi (strain GB-M1) TaxID=284813 RepID=Q8SUR3_ENCCU|nr:uncharacterized protein ECU08_0710 [Encephalitozoon cuniculi GB-M1]CAD26376.1 hypothetical protein [Encephalitozoon cuniculi GB-M1]
MKPIRLPLRRHRIEGGRECREDNGRETVDLKRFVSMFVNQTLKEMKEALGKFYSISETVCRRELSVFFRQKAADFECLFLLISGVEYLKDAGSNRHRIRKIKEVDGEYVSAADRLAYLFESFKSMIVPKSDVLTSLQTAYNPGYLLPKLGRDGGGRRVTSFEEIDRISRIYLDKEDLSVYSSVVIEEGIVILSTRFFSFSLALCGEISKPEWKLINVKGDNEVFNKHLLFAMPHRIDKISRFLRIYETHTKAREMFLMVKRSSEHIEMSIKGHYRRFEVSFHVFKMAVHVERCDIRGKLFVGEDVYPSGPDVIKSFEDSVSEYLCRDGRNVSFTFEKGFTVRDGKDGCAFRSFVDLDVFLERERENSVFYSFFEERFPCYRNHRSSMFGDRNVFIMRNGLFVCVRLVRLVEGSMEVRIFVGNCELVDFLSYTEVKLEVGSNGEVVGILGRREGPGPNIGIEDLHEYFEASMDLLFFSYRFLPVIDGNITVGRKILLSHRAKGDQIDIRIERRDDGFVVETSRFGTRTAGVEGIYGCVAFALLLMDVFTASRDSEVLSIISIDLSKGVSLRLSGFFITLQLNEEDALEASPLAVRHALGRCPLLGVMDLLCCFRAFFPSGLVPTTSTPTSLIFAFKHLFKGSVKVRLIDRTRYRLSLRGGRTRDIFGGFGTEILSSDTVFPRKLAGFYFKERIYLIADAARKSYDVTVSENEVGITTPCGHFKVWIENNRCMFRVCPEDTPEVSDEFAQTIGKYFGEAMATERNIHDSMKLLNSTDELVKLFKDIKSKEKIKYYNDQIH